MSSLERQMMNFIVRVARDPCVSPALRTDAVMLIGAACGRLDQVPATSERPIDEIDLTRLEALGRVHLRASRRQ